jgi:hypothetical protein
MSTQPLLKDLSEHTKHFLANEEVEWQYFRAGRRIMKQQRRSPFNIPHLVYTQR